MIALSTAEAEYIAAANCAIQAIWLRRMLGFLKHEEGSPTTLCCDSKSAIELTKHPVFHGRSKHIDIKFHFIRNLVNEKERLWLIIVGLMSKCWTYLPRH